MKSYEAHLPSLIRLEDLQGNWQTYLESIYSIFRNDLITHPPKLNKPFRIRRRPVTNNKENAFWHLISEGSVEEDRIPNLRRCERIAWIKPMINARDSEQFPLWKNTRSTKKGKDRRLLIATPSFDYVVILSVRKDYYLLCTAYPVEQRHRQEKLKKEFCDYKKTGDTF